MKYLFIPLLLIPFFTYNTTEWVRPPVRDIVQYDLHYTTIKAEVSAYNTVSWQTDGNPCIGAGGYICGRDDVLACPQKYSLGTKFEIEGKVYECLDRMNSRFPNRFDISMGNDISKAKEWGVKRLEVKIIN